MREIIFSIRKIYFAIIAVIGVPVNLVAIAILSQGKCGLSKCTSNYLVSMAVADLLVIIADVILYRISYYFFPGSFLDITPVCSCIFVGSRAATDCSVWFTVTFTFDRFVTICCQRMKVKYCTERIAIAVLASSGILLCFKNIPFYFIFEPGEIINNIPWFCYGNPSYLTDPRWVGFDWFDTILTPLLPFTLILLLNITTVQHILVVSRVRKGLKGQSNSKNTHDPEIENRRKSIILLFSISGSFIILWLPFVLEFLYYTVTEIDPGDYNDSEYIFRQVGSMLRSLSCCINTFIYMVTQSKFRDQFNNALKYPVTLFMQFINFKSH